MSRQQDRRQWTEDPEARFAAHREQIEDYIRGVLAGEIVASRAVRLAVERHARDLAEPAEWVFDEDLALYAVDFFPSCLVHVETEWAGERFWLEDWQAFIVWNLIGWRKADGTRKYKKALIQVARKNGKSTLCAGLALLVLFFDAPLEYGAQCYCAATKEDQAGIVFSIARRMVESSPLADLADVKRKNIADPSTGSFLRAIGSDSRSTDGLNPQLVIRDEIHEWQLRHIAFAEKLATGGGRRRQPLEISVTTAGTEDSAMWVRDMTYARRVLDAAVAGAEIDSAMFVFLCEIDPEDDPFDETVWAKANPSLNHPATSRTILRTLRDEARRARNEPSYLSSFLRYYMNRITASTERIVPMEAWRECDASPIDLEGAAGIGATCFGGIDLARSDDFAAIALVWPELNADGDLLYALHSLSITVERRLGALHDPLIEGWIREGRLWVQPGETLSYPAIQDRIQEWHEKFAPRNWAYDPMFATQMAQQLEEDRAVPVYKFYQTPRGYNEPIRRFRTAVAVGRIRHGGDPVLAWQVGNLAVKRTSQDLWMPDKRGKGKIDAAVATIMAFAGCLFGDKEPEEPQLYF